MLKFAVTFGTFKTISTAQGKILSEAAAHKIAQNVYIHLLNNLFRQSLVCYQNNKFFDHLLQNGIQVREDFFH